MKGITPVISVILLLLVAIAIVGLASGFFQRIFTQAGTGVDEQLNASTTQLGQTIKIDSAAGTSVVVRSTGSKTMDLSSVKVFADNVPQTCTWSSPTLAAGGTATCTLGTACTGKVVKASAPGGNAPETVTC
ncbi:MAG: hypothetical protein HYT72_03280 [Candidatus Aenigmarchaeota archaeon]|nr:hypothetical protein [Candidatus Aenigmarchaeota archaeon]